MTTFEHNGIQIKEMLKSGTISSRDLLQKLGISQPTLSRLAARLSDQVVTLGRARATLYGLLRDVRGTGGSFPVYRIDARGSACILGRLLCLHGGQFGWDAPRDGRVFYGLPWFLQDMRPEGFAGQAFAEHQQSILGLSGRLETWSDDDALVALSHLGEESVGNLLIGDESLSNYLRTARQGPQTIAVAERALHFPGMARAVEAGVSPGPLVGGAQPKFTAVIKGSRLRHVLVKFSPTISSNDGRRWADLLICEHLALQAVAAAGVPAAGSRIVEAAGRVFLEVDRFDRVGKFGRTPVISLGAIDDEFFGKRDSWAEAADRMGVSRMLGPEDARRLRWLSAFGDLIGNTDQHFGNISLTMVGDRRFVLAPAYDMLPMAYRPISGRVFDKIHPPSVSSLEVETAKNWAVRFWSRAATDPRISQGFRHVCLENRDILKAVPDVPRPTR